MLTLTFTLIGLALMTLGLVFAIRETSLPALCGGMGQIGGGMTVRRAGRTTHGRRYQVTWHS